MSKFNGLATLASSVSGFLMRNELQTKHNANDIVAIFEQSLKINDNYHQLTSLPHDPSSINLYISQLKEILVLLKLPPTLQENLIRVFLNDLEINQQKALSLHHAPQYFQTEYQYYHQKPDSYHRELTAMQAFTFWPHYNQQQLNMKINNENHLRTFLLGFETCGDPKMAATITNRFPQYAPPTFDDIEFLLRAMPPQDGKGEVAFLKKLLGRTTGKFYYRLNHQTNQTKYEKLPFYEFYQKCFFGGNNFHKPSHSRKCNLILVEQ